MTISKRLASAVGVLALTVGAVLALSSPAQASDNKVLVTVDSSDCGINITSAWATYKHLVANTVVVVLVDGTVHSAPVGTPLDLADLPAGTTDAQWRVWGGGERDYDDPALLDLDALIAHLAIGGDVLDVDAPGVAWHDLPVKGCKPKPTPTATADPEPTPTVEPSTDPTTDPTTDPSAEPSAEPSADPSTGPAPDDEDMDPVAGTLPETGAGVTALVLTGLGVASLGGLALGVSTFLTWRHRRKYGGNTNVTA